MAQQYRLSHPGLSSVSVDGVEHKVDPISGNLVVEVLTPNLEAELKRRGFEMIIPGKEPLDPRSRPLIPAEPELTAPEKMERDDLFEGLDKALGRTVDRKFTLPQLRSMASVVMEARQTMQAEMADAANARRIEPPAPPTPPAPPAPPPVIAGATGAAATGTDGAGTTGATGATDLKANEKPDAKPDTAKDKAAKK